MERCPVCRARLKQSTVCRRCGSDLALPITMEQKAQDYCQQALYHVQCDDLLAAKEAIQSALLLCNKDFFHQVSGFIEHLLAQSSRSCL